MKNRRADGNYMTAQNDFIDAFLKKIDESKDTPASRVFSGNSSFSNDLSEEMEND